jgi:hypothetical protein
VHLSADRAALLQPCLYPPFFRFCFDGGGGGGGVGEGVGVEVIAAAGEGVGIGFGFQAIVISSIRQPLIPFEMVISRCSVEAG